MTVFHVEEKEGEPIVVTIPTGEVSRIVVHRPLDVFSLYLRGDLDEAERFVLCREDGSVCSERATNEATETDDGFHLIFDGFTATDTLTLKVEHAEQEATVVFSDVIATDLKKLTLEDEEPEDDDAEAVEVEEFDQETLHPGVLRSVYLDDSPFLCEVVSGNELLKKGGVKAHEAVRKLQLGLIELPLGIEVGPDSPKLGVDGDFGSLTKAAVKRFQELSELAVDGLVGPHTLRTLDDELFELTALMLEGAPLIERGQEDFRGGADDRGSGNVSLKKVEFSPVLQFNYLGRTKHTVTERRRGTTDPLGQTSSVLTIDYALRPGGGIVLGDAQLEQEIELFTPYRHIDEFRIHYARYETEFNRDYVKFSKDEAVRGFHTRGTTYRHEAAHARTRLTIANRMMFGYDPPKDKGTTIKSYIDFLVETAALTLAEERFKDLSDLYWRGWSGHCEKLLSHDQIYEMDALSLLRELEDGF